MPDHVYSVPGYDNPSLDVLGSGATQSWPGGPSTPSALKDGSDVILVHVAANIDIYGTQTAPAGTPTNAFRLQAASIAGVLWINEDGSIYSQTGSIFGVSVNLPAGSISYSGYARGNFGPEHYPADSPVTLGTLSNFESITIENRTNHYIEFLDATSTLEVVTADAPHVSRFEYPFRWHHVQKLMEQ